MGHETDFTISDFVADLRAPTPSASAELSTQNVSNLIEQLGKWQGQLNQNIQRELSYLKQNLNRLNQALVNPLKKIQDSQQYLDDLNVSLKREWEQAQKLRKEQLNKLVSLLESLSPLKSAVARL